ncbi:hypothetical protein TNCV_2965711 [Trichonephila clavipes]|nr:hypothetical protein TNCV_2965711 [Trichonephila clavipes]
MERRLDNFSLHLLDNGARRNDHGWINARQAEILLEPLAVTLCGRCNIIDKREGRDASYHHRLPASFMNPDSLSSLLIISSSESMRQGVLQTKEV